MGRYWARLARPMPAAIIFCALGLTSAVLVVTFNRGVASQPPQQLPVVAATSAPSPSPSPTPSPAGACPSNNQVAGSLAGDTVTQDTLVQITDGSRVLSVGIPAGLAARGTASDIKLSASIPQAEVAPVTGTVVSNTTLCLMTPQGAATVTIAAGSSASGQVLTSSKGLLATGMEFKMAISTPPPPPAAPPPGPAGGDQGGD